MAITWDEPKRLSTLESRGLDFAELDVAFFAASTVVPAKLGRFMTIGVHRGDLVAVVFAPLGSEAIGVISMRRASRKERRTHEEALRRA